MKEVFVFDVDGTLTGSRQPIDPEFKTFMAEFIESHDVYLVTGSDRTKTYEQLGFTIYESCEGVWQCNGNEFWIGSSLQSKNDYTPDAEFKKFLRGKVANTRYPVKAGGHMEERVGMVNFSIVGRDCTAEQRKEYFAWDSKYHERYLICTEINSKYPKLHASMGGEISIDISPRGNNKSKAHEFLSEKYDHIHFFGDKMSYGGNDYPLAITIELSKTGTTYPVESYKQTWEVLKEL